MTQHFAQTVTGSGPGVILAHGAGGSIEGNFGPVLDLLAQTHTVVGVDYPGSGRTPRSRTPLSLDGLADELVGAADDVGLDRFTIIGYSLGSAVAVRAATRHPGRVGALVLIAGLARPDRRLQLALEVWTRLLDGDRRLLATFLTLLAAGRPHLEQLTDAELADQVEGLAAFVPDGSPEQVELVGRVDTRAELSAIGVPTLVVATTADLLVDPSHSHELAAGIPDAKLVEIAAGHDIGEAAQELFGVLSEFQMLVEGAR